MQPEGLQQVVQAAYTKTFWLPRNQVHHLQSIVQIPQHNISHLKFSDVLNADICILDNIDSYYTDPYGNIIPTQTISIRKINFISIPNSIFI